LDAQSILKIIDTSFIQTNERLNTEVNSKSKQSNEKLNYSDIVGIKEKNRVLKSEISIKERSLAEKEREIKNIQNVIKSPDFIQKYDNSCPAIPTSAIIQDLKYKPLIINDSKSIKNNAVKDISQLKPV